MHCYHHNDTDGNAAGYLVYKICNLYGIKTEPDSDYTSTVYTMEMSDHDKDEDIIFVVDISFTPDTVYKLLDMCSCADKVFWVDHHQSSAKLLEDPDFLRLVKNKYTNLYIYFSQDGCGALNTYYMYTKHRSDFENKLKNQSYPNDIVFIDYSDTIDRDLATPLWLRYVDDYDRWIKAIPETDNFINGLETYNTKLTVYDKRLGRKDINSIWINIDMLDDDYTEEFVKEGKTINRYLTNRYRRELGHAFEVTIPAHLSPTKKPVTILCKNAHHNSMNFLKKIKDYEAVSIFYFNGTHWVHSVYADKETSEFDCAAFCEQFGGGGHKGAAGFHRIKEQGPLWIAKNNTIII